MPPGTVVGTAILELLGDSAQFRAEMARAGARFADVGRRMESAGAALTAAVTLPIVGIGVAAGRAAISFESSFAGIRKTMDLTESQFQALASANRTLAKEIPVSVNELNRIGELAGQLGIRGVQNVLKFEDTIARLAVTTDLTADQGALAFAQIANVIRLPQDQVDRLAAAVVGLGNNFATTESRIVDFTQRIAGAGSIAGLTAGSLAGIATAFASMGVEAEAGGTAIQKVLIAMVSAVQLGGKELEAFADTAGVTATEFAESFRRDAAGAFASFVEGLGRQGNAAISTLERLGLQDQRLIRAFLAAAGAGDLLTRAIAQGNREFELNTALLEESNKRFETGASKLRLFWNRLVDVSITLGDTFLPILTDTLELLAPVLRIVGRIAEAFAALPRPVRLAVVGFLALNAALGPVLAVMGKLTIASATFSGILLKMNLAVVVAGFVNWSRAVIGLLPAVNSLNAALAFLQVAIGPAGWIVLGIGAVVAALAFWRKSTDDQTDAQDRLNTSLQDTNVQLIRGIEARIVALSAERAELNALADRYAAFDNRLANVFRTRASDLDLSIFQLRSQLDELTKSASTAIPVIGGFAGGLDSLGTAGGQAAIDLSALDQWADGFVPKMAASVDQLRQLRVELSGVQVSAVKMADNVTQATDQISASNALLFGSLATLADSFASFAAIGRQSFTAFAESVSRDIARMITRFLALKAVVAFLGGPTSSLGAAFATFAGLPGRADGGPVSANRPYLVGERGPELFVPRASGQVMANAGGGTVRLDLSGLPPVPTGGPPELAATHDWYRRLFSHLTLDYRDRGGL